MLDEIIRLDPDRTLPEKLANFAVAGMNSFGECQDLIRNAFDGDVDLDRAKEITWTLGIESHQCVVEKCEREREAVRAGEAELAGLIL